MLSNFRHWLEFVDAGPLPPTTPQDRQPHNVRAGLSGGTGPMRREPTTSAFPTYGGTPLPGNRKSLKKS